MREDPPIVVPMGEIVARRHLILSTLRRCKIPAQELPDLAQAVYLGAFLAMRAGRFHQGPLPLEEAIGRWLAGISWRTAARYHESAQRRERPSGVMDIEGPDPGARLEAREALRDLSALAGKHRTALIGAGLGFEAHEIAEEMSVSRATVCKWLRQGRAELGPRSPARARPALDPRPVLRYGSPPCASSSSTPTRSPSRSTAP